MDRVAYSYLHHQVDKGLVLELLRSEEHTSELQSRLHFVCRLLLEKKNRTRSCGCWSIRPFNAPVAPPRFMSTFASSPRPRATWRKRFRKGDSVRISTTGCRWCRSASLRCRNAARTSLN